MEAATPDPVPARDDMGAQISASPHPSRIAARPTSIARVRAFTEAVTDRE
jgi:hypothetical protein